MSKSSLRIFPFVFLLGLTVALGSASSFTTPTAAAPGPMQTASPTTILSKTTTTTYTSLSSRFSSTTTLTVTNATTSTSYTGTRTTGVTSLIVITATTSAIVTSTTTSTSTTSVVSFPASTPSCAMALVAAGTALEPYANSLREFRNNYILKTSSGKAFMSAFNSWYYSWAPSVARVAAKNQVFAEILRVALVPLFGILYAARYSYLEAAWLSPEAGAIMAGIVAASLIGMVYVAPITYVLVRVLRLRKCLLGLRKVLVLWTFGACLLIIAAYVLGSFALMGLATTSLVLSILTFGSIIGTRALASVKPFIITPASIVSTKPFKRKLA